MYYPCSENKGVINFAVTAQLICVFFFTYADCWFSHEPAYIIQVIQDLTVSQRLVLRLFPSHVSLGPQEIFGQLVPPCKS